VTVVRRRDFNEALTKLLPDDSLRVQAQAFGEQLRTEEGTGRECALINSDPIDQVGR